MKTNDKMLSEN